VLPFEFTVKGPPLSHQTNRRDRLEAWRTSVRNAALAARPPGEPLLYLPIEITVVYYHDGVTIRMDNDNLVKPIQDALNGYIYRDDRLITDTHVRKTPLDGSFRVRRMSQVLADAFVQGDEFIYVRLQAASATRSFHDRR
jgi:crossover junction endodeoxyribonuclease RusA